MNKLKNNLKLTNFMNNELELIKVMKIAGKRKPNGFDNKTKQQKFVLLCNIIADDLTIIKYFGGYTIAQQKQLITALSDKFLSINQFIAFIKKNHEKFDTAKPYVNNRITKTQVTKTNTENNSSINGLTFCFTGELKQLTRINAQSLVRDKGGLVSENITSKVDVCVVGNKAGAKFHLARKNKIKTITELTFLKLIGVKPNSNDVNDVPVVNIGGGSFKFKSPQNDDFRFNSIWFVDMKNISTPIYSIIDLDDDTDYNISFSTKHKKWILISVYDSDGNKLYKEEIDINIVKGLIQGFVSTYVTT